MIKRWEDSKNREIDLSPEMMRVTLEIVSRSLFSHDLSREADSVGKAMTTALHFVQDKVEAFVDWPLWIPTPSHRGFKKALRILDQIVYGIIQEREEKGEEKNDLLSMLMEVKDEESGEKMSPKQLRDEIMTLLMAGHETTANALTWIFYLLDRHPEIQEKLREECSFLNGNPPQLSDLQKLPLTRMVIDEGLRLYPPAWLLGRSPMQDENFDGYHVPAKSIVWISPYLTQHHPDFWEKPEVFNPYRFAPGAGENRHKYAYFPFGGGAHHCIGNELAVMEAQIILTILTQRYDIKIDNIKNIGLSPTIALTPKQSVTMRVKRLL